jgi:thiamine transport system permease protein
MSRAEGLERIAVRSRTGRRGRSATTGRIATLVATAVVPVAVLGVFFVLPVAGMVERGFVQHGQLDVGGVVDVLGRPEIRRAVWFTVWSSSVATLVACGLGLPAAFVLHRVAIPGRSWIRAVLVVPFVLPTVVVGVAFELVIGDTGPLGFLGLDGTPVAIVAGLVFFNASVVIRVVGGAWESLDPRPGEAAAALGASPRQVFRDVTLPALRPALVSAATVVFLFCATAFGIVLTLGGLRYSSVETQIYLLTTNLLDLQGAAALSVLQLLVVTVLLAAAARARRTPDAVVARSRVRLRRVRRGDLPALAATLLLLALVAGPLVSLVVASLRVDGAWSLDNYRALQTPGSHEALLVPVTDAVVNSLRIAVDATWMALLLGLSVATVVTRRSRTRGERRLRAVLDGLFMLPLGVSAVTLGFGFLITLGRPPLDLRDSALLIPIAQALVALPLVVRILVPVLGGIDDRLRQAAATLGASPLRALAVVDLPVIWKPLLAAAGFAFACSLGEFGATSFLVRDDRPTLPVVIFRLIGHPGDLDFGMALAGSVVLGATTALVMLLVERLRVPSVGTF